MRLDSIVYGKTLSGDFYRANNIGLWKVIHNLTVGGEDWDYDRIFECARYERGTRKATRGHL